MRGARLAATFMAVSAIAGSPGARADDPIQSGRRAAACLTAASATYHLPVGLLLILLQVEGGSLGAVSHNSNDTVDIGPMQVNSIWVPRIASRWHAAPAVTLAALRDSFCANIEAASWILRQSLDEAHGDLWEGVGLYHSHDPTYKADYLRKVLRVALHLQQAVARSPADPSSSFQTARNMR